MNLWILVKFEHTINGLEIELRAGPPISMKRATQMNQTERERPFIVFIVFDSPADYAALEAPEVNGFGGARPDSRVDHAVLGVPEDNGFGDARALSPINHFPDELIILIAISRNFSLLMAANALEALQALGRLRCFKRRALPALLS